MDVKGMARDAAQSPLTSVPEEDVRWVLETVGWNCLDTTAERPRKSLTCYMGDQIAFARPFLQHLGEVADEVGYPMYQRSFVIAVAYRAVTEHLERSKANVSGFLRYYMPDAEDWIREHAGIMPTPVPFTEERFVPPSAREAFGEMDGWVGPEHDVMHGLEVWAYAALVLDVKAYGIHRMMVESYCEQGTLGRLGRSSRFGVKGCDEMFDACIKGFRKMLEHTDPDLMSPAMRICAGMA